MKAQFNQTTLELVQGDITRENTDAIVNAANNSLLGGGGVDGAIHRAAGPQLLAATRQLNGCATGSAKMTPGFNLPARYVIHAVGPIFRPDDPDVPRLLASAYRTSLEIAAANDLHRIAFPSISTGVYSYPVPQAARIALQTVYDFTQDNTELALVRFVLFDRQTFQGYADALQEITG